MEIDERKEDVVEVFTEYLVNNGLKKSQERYVVLEAAGKMNGLFTAAELHTYLVNNMNFHLSPATVYSSIKLLLQCGILVGHFLSSKSVMFEYAYGKTSFKYAI